MARRRKKSKLVVWNNSSNSDNRIKLAVGAVGTLALLYILDNLGGRVIRRYNLLPPPQPNDDPIAPWEQIPWVAVPPNQAGVNDENANYDEDDGVRLID